MGPVLIPAAKELGPKSAARSCQRSLLRTRCDGACRLSAAIIGQVKVPLLRLCIFFVFGLKRATAYRPCRFVAAMHRDCPPISRLVQKLAYARVTTQPWGAGAS